MSFKCSKCGKCCRNLDKNSIYEDLHDGDGVCRYLDVQTNLCTVYDNRPEKCNVDLAYEKYFSSTYSKEQYYKLNYESCRNLKSSTINNTTLGIFLNNTIQKNGEAASQILQAYKGVRYDSLGNDLNYKGRSLKQIKNYKSNPNNSNISDKQQAGFAGELIKEARDNKKAIRSGDSTRTRNTDGIGQTNNQLHDHVKVDSKGNVIEGSGSQMKIKGKYKTKAEIQKSSENIVKDMVSDKWDKYSNNPMDLPSEQVELAKEFAAKKSKELKSEAAKQRSEGNNAKARELEELSKKYDKAEKNIRDSGVKSKEAMQAKSSTEKFVAKEMAKDIHIGGVEAAKSSFVLTGVISSAQNIYQVVFKEKDVEQACKDVAKDVGTSTAIAYGIGAGGTAIKAVMHSSKSTILKRVGNTNLPAMVATAVVEVGSSLKKYLNAEISELELVEELGEKGTGMIGAAIGGTIGSIIPGVGTIAGGIIGGVIGQAVSGVIYNQCMLALKSLRASEERRRIVERLAEDAIREMQSYEKALKEFATKELDRRDTVVRDILDAVDKSLMNGNINDFFSYMNSLGNEFGAEMQFNTFEEFNDFMLEEDSTFIL